MTRTVRRRFGHSANNRARWRWGRTVEAAARAAAAGAPSEEEVEAILALLEAAAAPTASPAAPPTAAPEQVPLISGCTVCARVLAVAHDRTLDGDGDGATLYSAVRAAERPGHVRPLRASGDRLLDALADGPVYCGRHHPCGPQGPRGAVQVGPGAHRRRGVGR